ncbi:hypothetical protein NSA50_18500 [Clostridium sp. DSM 100503]|uniref:hypothetical protein n=1 Tax=Clostridium sp. DSM 100503 TaxID=2963282 RepID=UPI00214A029E|nr:hypothetical protein [Clostridium sp. DSM 100503]MCR1952994.1 hypothetical protein [Clostridium sp. DSM 100503]
MSISEHLEKDKEIKKEINRLKKLYKDIDKDKAKALEGLIKDAAFMKVSLEGFREVLTREGITEIFKQGKQELKVERQESKLYLPYIQKYTQVMKLLIDAMPAEKQVEEEDRLKQFANRKKGQGEYKK